MTAVAALAVLAATGVIGYRVLTPADTLVAASSPYPLAPSVGPVRYGELVSAPLIVDGRLRIYAEARRVWADAELTARREVTPFWSFRRWPAEVAGVVAVEGRTEGLAVVIVKYSDGVVIALDARTGRIVWQDANRASERDRYEGRRTGAQTVLAPGGLFTARSYAGDSTVLIVAGGDQVRGYDPWTGDRKWEHTFTENPGCHDIDWTGETTYVAKDSCASPAHLDIFDAASGKVLGRWRVPGASAGPAEEANWYAEPVSCVRGRSGCRMIHAQGTSQPLSTAELYRNGVPPVVPIWRLNQDGTITPEPHAKSERPYQLGETLVQEEVKDSGHVKVVLRDTGAELWRSDEAMKLLAVNHFGVFGLTSDFRLVVLHPATGRKLSETDLLRRRPSTEKWVVGYVDVVDQMVVVERTTTANPRESDDRYYYGPSPVVIAGVNPS